MYTEMKLRSLVQSKQGIFLDKSSRKHNETLSLMKTIPTKKLHETEPFFGT